MDQARTSTENAHALAPLQRNETVQSLVSTLTMPAYGKSVILVTSINRMEISFKTILQYQAPWIGMM
jgi:hypothetical protein